MNFGNPFSHIDLLVRRIGWTGGLGMALLGASLVLLFALHLPVRQENTVLRAKIEGLQAQIKQAENSPAASTAPRKAKTAAEAQRQLDSFVASLPAEGRVNDEINKLHELATQYRLTLKNGEYRTTQSKTGRIGKLQIMVKTQGTYIDLRRFIAAIPEQLPALSLTRLALTRQKLSDKVLLSSVEFTLYYSITPTQARVAGTPP